MRPPICNPPPCNSASLHSSSATPRSFIPRSAYPTKSKREQNAERQREFRERNPGYYGRLHAKRRAAAKAPYLEQLAAERLKAQQTATIEVRETATIAPQESMPVVARETLHAPTIAESVKAMPATESTLPPQEAMLLLMLMGAVARLQKSRAAWE